MSGRAGSGWSALAPPVARPTRRWDSAPPARASHRPCRWRGCPGDHRRAVEGVGQHARAPDRLECGQIRGVLDHLGFEHTGEFGRHFEHHGEGQAHQALVINAQRDRHRAPIKERVFDSGARLKVRRACRLPRPPAPPAQGPVWWQAQACRAQLRPGLAAQAA